MHTPMPDIYTTRSEGATIVNDASRATSLRCVKLSRDRSTKFGAIFSSYSL